MANRDAGLGAGNAFERLVDIMQMLRSPEGCPWDREQTIDSLRGFVLEETYEVLDAIDRADHEALRGEIGDLLFEGVFLAQVETDAGRFSVTDSVRVICDKLIRRHPHIFGSTASHVRTPGQVVEQWEQIKAREQKDAGERRSLLRGVPRTLPSLLRAHEIGTRVAAVISDAGHQVMHEYLLARPDSSTIVELAMWSSLPLQVEWPPAADVQVFDAMAAPLCNAYLGSCR